eukprot:scaffold8629_cov114-Isochrysis_galbana.AAC.2
MEREAQPVSRPSPDCEQRAGVRRPAVSAERAGGECRAGASALSASTATSRARQVRPADEREAARAGGARLIDRRRCRPRQVASGLALGLSSNSVVSRSFSDSRRARKLEPSLAGVLLGGLTAAVAAGFLRVCCRAARIRQASACCAALACGGTRQTSSEGAPPGR